jgi:hypothetical protein
VQVAGFSGTNDNEPLLPLTVQAMASKYQHIQATDGRMLCTLACPDNCSVTCLLTSTKQAPMWSRLLDIAVQVKARALIDAGEHLCCLSCWLSRCILIGAGNIKLMIASGVTDLL